jgi:uncharacterized protein (DUF2236 family)
MAGYYNDQSLIRRVQRENIVLLAPRRALLMQAAHPVAFEGFFALTATLGDPYARLRRTADVIDTIVFGERALADRQTARVREVHRAIRGRLAAPAGIFPAGTPWAADDPELLLWIIATLADSGLAFYERFVGALSPGEREAYWHDHRVMGALFGLEPEQMPADFGAFEGYVHAMLDGDTLHVTPAARELAIEVILHPPVPLAARPALELANTLTIGLLPATLRRQYGLSWDPLRALAVRAGAEYARRILLPTLPRGLRERRLASPGGADRHAEQRGAAGDGGGGGRGAVRQAAPPGEGRSNVRQITGDRRRQPRPDVAPTYGRDQTAGVQDNLSHAEAAQRNLRRRPAGIRAEPAAREPLGRGDQRRPVGDPKRHDRGHR